ncbi:hypothetical protein Acr_08g0012540 [Actinidia rufa]|uniref:Uncharacterized protein n=1 Tax=Actinidia rufa TaxID=165716 RepID=A0A7J0F2D2_9ERIC|nr:hypothetical protein Acr_08g0012540 [Actinidia rufa]
MARGDNTAEREVVEEFPLGEDSQGQPEDVRTVQVEDPLQIPHTPAQELLIPGRLQDVSDTGAGENQSPPAAIPTEDFASTSAALIFMGWRSPEDIVYTSRIANIKEIDDPPPQPPPTYEQQQCVIDMNQPSEIPCARQFLGNHAILHHIWLKYHLNLGMFFS